MNNSEISEIEKILEYCFKDKTLLVTSFTHSSYSNENNVESYERLEFFGDSILEFIVREYLYINHNKNEGIMSKSKTKIVSEKPLSQAIDSLKLSKYLRFGIGQAKAEATSAIKSDLFEAIIACMYLDSNDMNVAKKSVLKNLKDKLNIPEEDFKTKIKEYVDKKKIGKIEYIATQSGEGHNPQFSVKLIIDNKLISRGSGGKKKQAENIAAKKACEHYKII